ncbi:MAG: RNA ligase family protein [Nanoarchaeota archaeon]|nr:RNA ligase family protein [Nanoarchaeota archaeon]
MVEFRKYMHIEKYGNDEVQGIELGECYIFPKIDGSNGSVWLNNGLFQAGSRNRVLSLENDNQGFMAEMVKNGNLIKCLLDNPEAVIYGEWLVPHTLKIYREDARRKFYIFDVWDGLQEKYLSYPEYQPILNDYKLNYIPPLCVTKNANYDGLLNQLKNNMYLVKDGSGQGEGIVIKNYSYQNGFGRTVWAKIVANEFKENHSRVDPIYKKMKQMVEQEICDSFITEPFVRKVYAKIVNDMNGWNSKYIPRLLSTVYYDLVNEELWNAVKKLKNPTINFKTLSIITTQKVKEIIPEVF